MSSKQAAYEVAGEVGLVDLTGSTNGHKPDDGLAYHFTISGKQVRIKRTLSAKDGRWLPKITRKMMETGDLFDQVPLAMLLIESWDFPGDPGTPESYDDFELFELTALFNAIGKHVNARDEQVTTKN